MIKFEKFEPAIPIIPGRAITRKLEYLNMTQKELAVRVGCSEKHISNIINGKAEIEIEFACRISDCIGIDAEILLKLELSYRDTLRKIPSDEELEELKKFPYNELVKLEYIPKAIKPDEKVFNLRKYFGVSNLTTVQDIYSSMAACRKQETEKPKDYFIYSWIRQAEKLIEGITAPKYTDAGLALQLNSIRECSVDNNYDRLKNICSQCGVILLLSKHIPNSGIYAITFKKNDNYVIMLSVRNKAADQFWFSFFHEIYHVLFDKISSDTKTEAEADKYAADFLITPSDYSSFVSEKRFNICAIRSFAKKIGIHPCIVVGRLKRDGHIDYQDTKYKKLIPMLSIV
jgi:HTH-type transcriptional regulator/antitoxin HigA